MTARMLPTTAKYKIAEIKISIYKNCFKTKHLVLIVDEVLFF